MLTFVVRSFADTGVENKHGCQLCQLVFSRQTALIEHYARKHHIDNQSVSVKKFNVVVQRGENSNNVQDHKQVKKKRKDGCLRKKTQCGARTIADKNTKIVWGSVVPDENFIYIATKCTDMELSSDSPSTEAKNKLAEDSNLEMVYSERDIVTHIVDNTNASHEREETASCVQTVYSTGDKDEDKQKIMADSSQKVTSAGGRQMDITHENKKCKDGVKYPKKNSSASTVTQNNSGHHFSYIGKKNRNVGQDFVETKGLNNGSSFRSDIRDIEKSGIHENNIDLHSADVEITTSVKNKTNDQVICCVKECSDSGPTAASKNTVGEKMITRFNLQTKGLTRDGKTLSLELNMPDFYFIHKIEQLGQLSDSQQARGRDQFHCIFCGEKFNWRRTICRHMREKHRVALSTGQADKIPEIYDNSGNGRLMKMSDYIEIETSSKVWKRLRAVERQDMLGIFPCEKCGKMFNRLRNYRKHQVTHKKSEDYLCSFCVKKFKTAAYLKQHMKRHTKEREAFKCSECDFSSTSNIAIHQHRQIHSKNTVLCEICGNAYNDKSTLVKHMRVHDPARPFQCTFPGCCWRFRSQIMCNAHMQAHTSKGKFQCSVCGYAFRKKHHLQRHEMAVHSMTVERQTVMQTKARGQNSNSSIEKPEFDTEENIEVDENNSNGDIAESGQFDFEESLHNNQLVIATDDNINYEMSDIGTNIVYQTLLQDGEGNQLDSQTILLQEGNQLQNVEGNQMESQTILLQEGSQIQNVDRNQIDSQTILIPEGIHVLYQQDIQSTDITEIEINSGPEMVT